MCYIIAEAGLNHNGSMGTAKQLIKAAADAGANAVKFQKRDLESFFSQAADHSLEQWLIREGLEFTEMQMIELYVTAKRYKIDFICTAFDIPSVDKISGITKYIKIPSHRVTDIKLLKYVADLGIPVIISSGMCTLQELDKAMDILKFGVTDLTLLHCVSAYPTSYEECNLNMIPFLRGRYCVDVGYSGHELGYKPTLYAVVLGAVVVERHLTLDRFTTGFDHKISLEPPEFKSMVAFINKIKRSLGTSKKTITDNEWITRRKYVND